MVSDPSIVKKTESLIDDVFDLWHRRRGICIIVIFIIVLPTLVSVCTIPWLKSKLDEAKRQRDKAEVQLAPFLAAANRSFPDVPQNERLDRLSEKLDKIIGAVQEADRNILIKLKNIEEAVGNIQDARQTPSQRILSQAAVRRLSSSLELISGYQVEITCLLGDGEGHALAAQIKNVFENAGWEVKGVNQAVFAKAVRHLIMQVDKPPPVELQKALLPLFDSLGYPREASLNPKLPEKSLKIIVGSR